MHLEGKNIVIFIEKYYEENEFWYPYYRMKEAGCKVTVIGPKKESYTGKNGLPAKADKAITEVSPDEFDALIIPGGYSPDHMRRSPEMIAFVKEIYIQGKVVAAICHAPWMLVSAGILNNKNVTSFFSIKDDVINSGAKWSDNEVVVDNNIITSRNPSDLPAFCKAIIHALVPVPQQV